MFSEGLCKCRFLFCVRGRVWCAGRECCSEEEKEKNSCGMKRCEESWRARRSGELAFFVVEE